MGETNRKAPSKSGKRKEEHAGASRSLARAMETLALFERVDATVLRSEHIVSELGLPRTTVYRILRALKQGGFIQSQARGEVGLGPTLRRLAELAAGAHDIGSLCVPELQRLTLETGESSFIATRAGTTFRYAAFVESPQDLRVSGYVGKSVPLHAAATGKLLLAFAPVHVVERLLAGPLEAITESTVTDHSALREELERIRRQGFAISSNEANAGGTGVSVPVEYGDGGTVAAVTVIGPDIRLRDAALTRATQKLLESAKRLAGLLSREGQA